MRLSKRFPLNCVLVSLKKRYKLKFVVGIDLMFFYHDHSGRIWAFQNLQEGAARVSDQFWFKVSSYNYLSLFDMDWAVKRIRFVVSAALGRPGMLIVFEVVVKVLAWVMCTRHSRMAIGTDMSELLILVAAYCSFFLFNEFGWLIVQMVKADVMSESDNSNLNSPYDGAVVFNPVTSSPSGQVNPTKSQPYITVKHSQPLLSGVVNSTYRLLRAVMKA